MSATKMRYAHLHTNRDDEHNSTKNKITITATMMNNAKVNQRIIGEREHIFISISTVKNTARK
jgi:hypothetical protein